MLSDCSGAHWWNNSAPRALHLWGQHGPVGILQPLAERLWRRTAAPPIPGMAQARRRAAPNTEVLFTPHDASPGHGMPVPVMEVPPDWLGDWARLIASSSSPALPMAAAYVQDMPMTRAEPLRRELDLPISERVQRFQASASPEAVRLAAYVAVSVPTLPIMQLIHHQMLRNLWPSNIAEVLLSGLLRSIEDWPGAYELVLGARQALLATLPRSESWYAADVLSACLRRLQTGLMEPGKVSGPTSAFPRGLASVPWSPTSPSPWSAVKLCCSCAGIRAGRSHCLCSRHSRWHGRLIVLARQPRPSVYSTS